MNREIINKIDNSMNKITKSLDNINSNMDKVIKNVENLSDEFNEYLKCSEERLNRIASRNKEDNKFIDKKKKLLSRINKFVIRRSGEKSSCN